MGFAPQRFIVEDRSRNTWENLVYSKRIARPRQNQIWILAGSASRLPLAMEVASDIKWDMLPWATDYSSPRNGLSGFFDVSENLRLADLACHEWVGLIAYRLGKEPSG
jgi:uncharacterized SAM-binding protein YcdF (DUF218 family)